MTPSSTEVENIKSSQKNAVKIPELKRATRHTKSATAG